MVIWLTLWNTAIQNMGWNNAYISESLPGIYYPVHKLSLCLMWFTNCRSLFKTLRMCNLYYSTFFVYLRMKLEILVLFLYLTLSMISCIWFVIDWLILISYWLILFWLLGFHLLYWYSASVSDQPEETICEMERIAI